MENKINFFLNKYEKYTWVIFIVAGFILYGRTLTYDFAPLDDNLLITSKKAWLSDFGNIFQSFGQGIFQIKDSESYYRPMLTVSYIIDTLIGHGSAWMYHLTNVLFHILSSFLCFVLLNQITKNKLSSFFLAFLFCIHPVFAPAVSWISGRNDTLLAIFILSSIIYLNKYISNNKIKDGILSLIFFIFALFTKETSLIFIFLIIFYVYFIFSLSDLKRIKGYLAMIIIFTIAFIFIKNSVVKPELAFSSGLLKTFFTEGILAYLIYAGKFVFPIQQSIIPSLQSIPLYISVVTGFVGFCFLTYLLYIRKRLAFLGLIWFIIFITPSIIITCDDMDGFFYEHRTYLPFLGLILCSYEIIKNFKFKKVHQILMGVLAILLCFKTVANSSSYQSQEIFLKTIRIQSHKTVKAWNINGDYAYRNKNYLEAIRFYSEAIKINPKYFQSYAGRSIARMQASDYENSMSDINTAIQLKAKNIELYKIKAILYIETNEYQKAINTYSIAINIDNENVELLSQRANLYLSIDSLQNALKDYNSVIKLSPTQEFYLNRANILISLKKYEQAEKDIEIALTKSNKSESIEKRIKKLKAKIEIEKFIGDEKLTLNTFAKDSLPKAILSFLKEDYFVSLKTFEYLTQNAKNEKLRKNEMFCRNCIGLCYAFLGKFVKAENYFNSIIIDSATYDRAYSNLGMIYKIQKRDKDARLYFEKAFKINPKNLDARRELIIEKK